VSLDDLAAAASGRRPLPDKAILLTFEGGRRSLYTRVFPLLKAYSYPAVATLVGAWEEDTPDGKVRYGDEQAPRTDFVSWDEAREMQASGLVEFGSQSYDLQRGVRSNPQGNMAPAAVTWIFDPRTGRYEDDQAYLARVRADLARSVATMKAQLGRAPRAIAWPYGRYTGPAIRVAGGLGLSFGLSLEGEPAFTSNLGLIPRYAPFRDPQLRDIAPALAFEPGGPRPVRIACVSLEGLAAAGDPAAQDAALGRTVEGLRTLGANTVVIEGAAAPPPGQAALGEVYFPSALRPLRADLLGRATWQIGTRAGADVYLHLPLAPAAAAVGEANVPRLFAEMARYARADGIVIDLPEPVGGTVAVANRPEDFRARRAQLDTAQLDHWTALGIAAYRAAVDMNPRLRLMVFMARPDRPPAWADMGLLPPSRSARDVDALARQLRRDGWLKPGTAGRVAVSLPQDPAQQVEAVRLAMRQGVFALALCPNAPPLPPPAALAAEFSAAAYPHRP
jgi:peptidoglycan/xylan/chitin deacetylase (PgdA/CDA1 family)